jgi:hypothetical protein
MHTDVHLQCCLCFTAKAACLGLAATNISIVAAAAMQYAQLYRSLHAALCYKMFLLQVAPFDLLDSLEQLDLDVRQIQHDALTLPVQEEAPSAAQKILSTAGSSKQ